MHDHTVADYIGALRGLALERPNFEFANYTDVRAYRADTRASLRDRDDALALLAYLERVASLGTPTLQDFERAVAWGGRIVFRVRDGKLVADHEANQYWPTEYRASVARFASGILWEYFRDYCIPKNGQGADAIRNAARSALGKRLARRWFR